MTRSESILRLIIVGKPVEKEHLTDPFTASELRNPPKDVSILQKVRQRPKLWCSSWLIIPHPEIERLNIVKIPYLVYYLVLDKINS